jgi:BMFP domain-containing protein YqiC
MPTDSTGEVTASVVAVPEPGSGAVENLNDTTSSSEITGPPAAAINAVQPVDSTFGPNGAPQPAVASLEAPDAQQSSEAKLEQKMRRQCRQMFDKMDVDHNGLITKEELEKFYIISGSNPHENAEARTHLEAQWAKADPNGSGKIAQADYENLQVPVMMEAYKAKRRKSVAQREEAAAAAANKSESSAGSGKVEPEAEDEGNNEKASLLMDKYGEGLGANWMQSPWKKPSVKIAKQAAAATMYGGGTAPFFNTTSVDLGSMGVGMGLYFRMSW